MEDMYTHPFIENLSAKSANLAFLVFPSGNSCHKLEKVIEDLLPEVVSSLPLFYTLLRFSRVVNKGTSVVISEAILQS